jgi:hypothetical protein
VFWQQEGEMVFRLSDDGKSGWHEPPYTEEEEFEFYRRYDAGMASGKATIYRSQRPGGSAGKQAPAKEPQQEEK